MRSRQTIARRLASATALLLGFGTGSVMAAICDGNSCLANVDGCVATLLMETDSCCKDLDHDSVSHCVTCTRRLYQCQLQLVAGPGFDCANPGAECLNTDGSGPFGGE